MLLQPILYCVAIKLHFAGASPPQLQKKLVRPNHSPTESVYTGLQFVVNYAFGTVICACKLFNLQYHLWYMNSVEEQSNLTCFFISWRDNLHEIEPHSCNAKMIFVMMSCVAFERGCLEWFANGTHSGVCVVRNMTSGKNNNKLPSGRIPQGIVFSSGHRGQSGHLLRPRTRRKFSKWPANPLQGDIVWSPLLKLWIRVEYKDAKEVAAFQYNEHCADPSPDKSE